MALSNYKDRSSFRYGKWSREEEEYAAVLMKEFAAGTLPAVEEGVSLRGFLAEQLRCNPKRISKKVSFFVNTV